MIFKLHFFKYDFFFKTTEKAFVNCKFCNIAYLRRCKVKVLMNACIFMWIVMDIFQISLRILCRYEKGAQVGIRIELNIIHIIMGTFSSKVASLTTFVAFVVGSNPNNPNMFGFEFRVSKICQVRSSVLWEKIDTTWN